MFCPKCGTGLENGAKFCPTCGAAASEQAQGSNFSPNTGAGAGVRPKPIIRSAYGALRALVKSPLSIIAASLYSLAIILNLFNSASMSLGNTLYQLFDMVDLGYEFYQVYNEIAGVIDTISLSVTIISMLPTIIIALGLWIAIYQALSTSSRLGTSGFTVIKVIVIIRNVCTCISLALFELALIIGWIVLNEQYSGYYYSDPMGTITPIMIVSGLIIAVVLGLVIAFYAGVQKTLNSASAVVRSGNGNVKISAYAAVISMIGGIIGLIGGLATGVGAGKFAAICSAVAAILFCVLTFKFRNDVGRFATPYGASMYGSAWQTQNTPQSTPLYTPQGAPQSTPLYTPQNTPQSTPLYTPQNAPQSTPMYTPQSAPQNIPQDTPQQSSANDPAPSTTSSEVDTPNADYDPYYNDPTVIE